MKFSHSLQFNSVPDWSDKYINYSNLKKIIYQLEQDQTSGDALADSASGAAHDDDIEHESAALLTSSMSTADAIFVPMLDKELRRIVGFYGMKEADLQKSLDKLREDLHRAESDDVFDLDDEYSDEDGMSEAEGGDDVNESAPTTYRGTQNTRTRKGSVSDLFTDPLRYNEASRQHSDLHGWHSSTKPKMPRRRSSKAVNDLVETEVANTSNDPSSSQNFETSATTTPSRSRRLSQSFLDEEGPRARRSSNSAYHTTPARKWTSMFKRKPSERKTLGLISSGGLPVANNTSEIGRSAESEAGASSNFGDKTLSIWTAENDWAIDMRITYKKRISDLFVDMSELKQFVSLNETGFKKILKKYDKILKSNLKERYFAEVINLQYPFQSETRARLEENIQELTEYFAKVVTNGDIQQATAQLKTLLREQVVWQRNTVWREMIGIERRAQGATLEQTVMQATQDGEKAKPTRIRTPFGAVTLPAWLGISTLQLLTAFTLLVLLLKAPGLRFFSRVEEQNCLAMLIFCTILWATEVIPLFVTSLLVPFLVVVLQVARTDDIEDRRMSASETTKWIFSQMFQPNMVLLLGGFTLAAALSKYSIDKILAQKVLRYAGTRPSIVLLAHMGVACFASMWISNVAAPVLMYSLIQPILRNLPSRSPYASALIMGIALASNIGGQTSPIASPQNLIALQYMDEPLGWLQWFAITIPVSGISLIVIWILLMWSYGSGRGTVIKKMPERHDRFTGIQYFISAVALGTIALWCLERNFEYILGDMGVIAIVPMILFFGTGILTKEDFNNFLWTIVFLAMGGIALGKAVTSSGLLASLDELIQDLVKGMPIWQVLLSLLSISLVVATFISHTIAAVLLVPIAAQVGDSLAQPHPRLLIMATTLTASAAMGLPVSGFPNMAASAQEDATGKRYVTVKDFLRVGLLASVLATMVVGLVGFGIMTLLKL
ncbi:hypothetical protein L7F22_019237 [Adiantum nelumboides]|nr:hypothetical protein [Adiantum nelumboides]